MGTDSKSLVLGIIVGIAISILVFAGGVLAYKHFESVYLKVPANQTTSLNFGGRVLNFYYYPDVQRITAFENQSKTDGFPANLGFGGSFRSENGSCYSKYTVVEVKPDYVALLLEPLIFNSIVDATSSSTPIYAHAPPGVPA